MRDIEPILEKIRKTVASHRLSCEGEYARTLLDLAPGEKPRALQLHRHAQLRARGFSVFVLDDPARVPVILDHTDRVPPIHATSDCNEGESNETNRLT